MPLFLPRYERKEFCKVAGALHSVSCISGNECLRLESMHRLRRVALSVDVELGQSRANERAASVAGPTATVYVLWCAVEESCTSSSARPHSVRRTVHWENQVPLRKLREICRFLRASVIASGLGQLGSNACSRQFAQCAFSSARVPWCASLDHFLLLQVPYRPNLITPSYHPHYLILLPNSTLQHCFVLLSIIQFVVCFSRNRSPQPHFTMLAMHSINCDGLRQLLELIDSSGSKESANILIIDCRSFFAHNDSHIINSINVFYPPFLRYVLSMKVAIFSGWIIL